MSTTRPFQVALLTGPSDRRGWALSPAQDAFLRSLGVPGDALVLLNFPYEPDTPPQRAVPLLFAYGPVARRRPDCRHLLVSGRQDRLSRLFFPAPDHSIDCTHLTYLSSPILRELCVSYIAGEIGSLSLIQTSS
jgi:hypothetical protein